MTFGAEAVGGVLSTVVVPVTVLVTVLVSANADVAPRLTRNAIRIIINLFFTFTLLPSLVIFIFGVKIFTEFSFTNDVSD